MSDTPEKMPMRRFEPKLGWSEASAPVVQVKELSSLPANTLDSSENMSAEALINLGESIQDVFDSLKINDPRLQAWTQIHSTIRLIGGKLQEKKSLEELHAVLTAEIESLRALATEMVIDATKQELEVLATANLRVKVAEALNAKLLHVLKN